MVPIVPQSAPIVPRLRVLPMYRLSSTGKPTVGYAIENHNPLSKGGNIRQFRERWISMLKIMSLSFQLNCIQELPE